MYAHLPGRHGYQGEVNLLFGCFEETHINTVTLGEVFTNFSLMGHPALSLIRATSGLGLPINPSVVEQGSCSHASLVTKTEVSQHCILSSQSSH